MDKQTILDAINGYKAGLANYPGESLILYAGKAFLNLAMCKIVLQENIGLDVVSQVFLLYSFFDKKLCAM